MGNKEFNTINNNNYDKKYIYKFLNENMKNKKFYYFYFSIFPKCPTKKMITILKNKLQLDIYNQQININEILDDYDINDLYHMTFYNIINEIFIENINKFPIKYTPFLNTENYLKKLNTLKLQIDIDYLLVLNLSRLNPKFILEKTNNEKILLMIAHLFDFDCNFNDYICLKDIIPLDIYIQKYNFYLKKYKFN